MTEGDSSKPVKCRKRWGYCGLIAFTYLLVAMLFMAEPILPWGTHESLFIKIFWVALGLFLFLAMFAIFESMHYITLYICEDGLGVQYSKGSIKRIHWNNIDTTSNIPPIVMIKTLCFRFKAYGPWLDQFSEPELHRYLSRYATVYALFGRGYIDRKLEGNEEIKVEIAALPPQSLQQKLAQRMFSSRKQNGLDLGFTRIQCVRKDLDKIEASYVAWVAKQKIPE